MGTVYLRGSIWWIGFVGSDGRWHYKSAKTVDEAEARARLAAIEEELRQGRRFAEMGPLSVAEWGERWQALRLQRVPKLWNAEHEWKAVTRHALAVLVDERKPFGRMRLDEVRARHALALIRGLRQLGLAPRTIANIWGTVHKLFADAVIDELIGGNPMVLPDTERPRRVDADPAWRKTAVFSRAEAEALVSREDLDDVRRVLYAMALLAGMREGEVLDRRWRDYDADAQPLGRLSVHSSYTRHNRSSKTTKTEQPREVPVHPALASLLAAWRLGGWREAYGRPPEPDDFIILNTRGRQGDDQFVLDGLKRDLEALGLRHRRYHDMRRTFISLARADGAPKDVLRCVTHSGAGDIVDSYTSFDWPTLCAAVAKLNLGRPARPTTALTTARR